MKQFQGIWFTDGEQHFPEWMAKNGEMVDGKGTYQIKKYREAMKWVRNFRCAVDVGGHVGLWSMQMAKRFDTVHAFEPIAELRECFILNAGVGSTCVALHALALGAAPGMVSLDLNPADTGGTHVVQGEGPIKMITLDSLYLHRVDFIKIDCEGYELEVLKGAVETIDRHHPCIIVEQKPRKLAQNFGTVGAPAVDFLEAMGAKRRKVISGDYILSWD